MHIDLHTLDRQNGSGKTLVIDLLFDECDHILTYEVYVEISQWVLDELIFTLKGDGRVTWATALPLTSGLSGLGGSINVEGSGKWLQVSISTQSISSIIEFPISRDALLKVFTSECDESK